MEWKVRLSLYAFILVIRQHHLKATPVTECKHLIGLSVRAKRLCDGTETGLTNVILNRHERNYSDWVDYWSFCTVLGASNFLGENFAAYALMERVEMEF